MEALLPSEIARLVFGYLEDQKCNEAARSFLEASAHLQECRTAVLNGRRFNTRVNGHTLVDIFDKFSAAHSLVQERLSKVGDCEQVRHCGDLLEQLRFLIGGSRGQRFVVNINVPSQANSQTYGGSPIITSSIRKRYHSSSDRDRTKRAQKPLHQLFGKQLEPVSSQLGCETVEATPLESLPGHSNLSTPHRHEYPATQDSDGVYCTSTKNDFTDAPLLGDPQFISKQICHHSNSSQQGMDQDNSSGRSERYSPVLVLGKEKIVEEQQNEEEKGNSMGKGKSTATSTDELTTYSSIEVQTTPYAISDSESIGIDDEPIENLSLLTKELLNRTELQERIAENINKAILPIEMPSKDESICESMGGELNTSIMAELNNAIKSIVAATETDPIFEHFLDEIIGPNVDTDTSPDEDHDIRIASEAATTSRICTEQSNTTVVDMDLEEESAVISNKGQSSNRVTEVPLKQRLRSSSRQHNNKLEDEGDKPKDIGRTDSSLEDHNAAAIMSIINANIVSEKLAVDKNIPNGNNATVKPGVVVQSTELPQAATISAESQIADSTEVVENDPVDCKSTGNLIADSPVCSISKPNPEADQRELITEQEMMAMPTLIVCSREEMRDCISVDTIYSARKAVPSSEARFVPIAPKVSQPLEPVKPVYLKAVQVPIQIPRKIQPAINTTELESIKAKPLSSPKISAANRKRSRKVMKKPKNLKPTFISTNAVINTESSSAINKEPIVNTDLESITLYANDNSFGTMIETGNMPSINLDDSMTLTGTGLSPYLKFHDSKSVPQSSELSSGKLSSQVPIEELDATNNKADVPIVLPHTENILITKRTPKSLLKSRSKNNRLSLSTPRRRSSHIRALDFNTPPKSSTSEHKSGGNKSLQFSSKSSKRARSVCRTSLFKSPPFSHSLNPPEKRKTPEKNHQLYKVPIATRSPAPKLMGGWDKYTGVGMILGGTSPHPSSTSSFTENEEARPPAKSSVSNVKKSWDADLRQALQEYQESTCLTSTTKKGTAKTKSRGTKNSGTDAEVKDSKSEKNITQEINSTGHKIRNVSSEEQNNSKITQAACSLMNRNVELSVQNEPVPNDKSDVNKLTIKTKEIPVVKKYAKLKTLETKISKYKKGQIVEDTALCSADSSQKKCEYLKISPEMQSQPSHMSRLVDLETPRKADNSNGIPPTPRLLSPSSSTITPFTKIAEELSKVPSFISTPDFPPTPSIALTPKVIGENTIDAIKKGEYGTCSPYYQPSTEQPDILEKLVGGSNSLKDNAAEVLTRAASVNLETKVGDEHESATSNFASSKLEITQFEVIKENLPKKEADKELKISTNLKNAEEILPKVDNPASGECRDLNAAEDAIERGSNHEDCSSSGNESSNSSSSNTSSSSSCSSSCSCSSITTTSTPFKSVTKCKAMSNTSRDASNDCPSKNIPASRADHNLLNEISPIIAREVFTASNTGLAAIQTLPSIHRGETSPVKLLPLIKSQEEVDASEKETPAKDEALLTEANISETPSSSKSGIESLTNLNSKISALDCSGDQGSLRKNHVLPPTRQKCKITSVQHLLPDVSVALKPPLVSEIVSSTTQPSNNLSSLSSIMLDGKLGMHLEEKRLRLMAKLKNKPQPKIMPQKAKAKQVNLNTKNKYKTKQEVSKSISREQKTCVDQTESCNRTTKVTQVLEKKEVNVTSTKILSKQKSENPSERKVKVIHSKAISVKLSSKERKYNECSTNQGGVKKLSNINGQKASMTEKKDGEFFASKQIRKVDDEPVAEKKDDRRCSIEISDLNIGTQRSGEPTITNLDSEECVNMHPANSTDIVKDLKIPSEIINHPTTLTRPTSSVSQNRESPAGEKDATEQEDIIKDKLLRSSPSCREDEVCGLESAVVPVKKSQPVPMSKVDQIKRDLFSDEENSDQRTTRSRTRQLSDAQKNDPVLAAPESASQVETKACQAIAKKPKEELASVLECLKLVPANKNETADKPSTSPKSSINKYAEYQFVYDDSIPIKKKRLKFSSSNLQYVINVELHDENYRECPRLMTPTNYEEIFNISPKPKKRVVAKKLAIKSSKSVKADTLKPTSAIGTILKNELIKPLASSSPSLKSKALISKVGKSTAKVQHQSLKPADKDDKNKLKADKQVLQKRKITDSEEEHSGEKKRRIADPQTLLKKLDLDLFLTSVHGPI